MRAAWPWVEGTASRTDQRTDRRTIGRLFGQRMRQALWLGGLLVAAAAAQAGLPAAYAPWVIEGERSADGQSLAFDLRPAFAAARARGKPRLYIYLGADTCPFCRRYEAFLAREVVALRPHFDREWLLVDLRSSLSIRGDRLLLRLDDGPWRAFVDFNRALGDERTRGLVYPNVWLLDGASRRPLMQMPAGTGTFETVDEQLEILRLEP